MRTCRRLLGIAACLLMIAACARAEDTIPHRAVITNAQMIGMGYSALLDNYLSPEEYTGAEIRYMSHTTREYPGSRWARQVVFEGVFATDENRAGNTDELSGLFDFSYALRHKWRLMGNRIEVQAGGTADVTLGFVYNTRNGNNPAQAKASLNIGPTAAATYAFRLFRRNMSVRYEWSMPLLGVMFSPNYGQSYYEIFSLGNYDHNVVPTTVASTPSMRHALTADVPLWGLTWRVGYMGDYRQTRVNGLKYHSYSHLLMVGVVRKFKITNIRP